jgi:hypothetical protein
MVSSDDQTGTPKIIGLGPLIWLSRGWMRYNSSNLQFVDCYRSALDNSLVYAFLVTRFALFCAKVKYICTFDLELEMRVTRLHRHNASLSL